MDCGDVLSVDGTSRKEVRGEEGQVRPLRIELKKQYPSYDVEQCHIIIDVLGRWSRHLELIMRKLFGSRGYHVLRKMQKATISTSPNTVRTFKATVTWLFLRE